MNQFAACETQFRSDTVAQRQQEVRENYPRKRLFFQVVRRFRDQVFRAKPDNLTPGGVLVIARMTKAEQFEMRNKFTLFADSEKVWMELKAMRQILFRRKQLGLGHPH